MHIRIYICIYNDSRQFRREKKRWLNMELIGILLTGCAIALYNVGCVVGYVVFGFLAVIIFIWGMKR